MPLATSWSVALVGLDGKPVRVEADLAQGVPGVTITGLPDTALQESRDRMKAAVLNSGSSWPSNKRITIGLSPASLPKRGSGFDLALVAAVLAADGAFPIAALEGVVFLGELGLDGSVRGVQGVLPALVDVAARFSLAVVAADNLPEARLLPDLRSVGVRSLHELVWLLRGEPYDAFVPEPTTEPSRVAVGDFSDVAGQIVGRLACEVAAAGGHNLFMTGPPGCGKTLLAERMPGILPPLSLEESLQVTAIHSVAGQLPAEVLVSRPPFQAPHHGSTQASIIGGGSGIAKPGAASLAHRGVLFLDEAPEFKSGVLDALRQPLESGVISIRRVGGTATYPARFSLLLAANPCPCARTESSCTCSADRRRSYIARLSGPLLDRMDITVSLPAITRHEVMGDRDSLEDSATIAIRVAAARQSAADRLRGTPWRTNADVPPTELMKHWPLARTVLEPAADLMDRGALTARGFGRVQRLAWTLADLSGRPSPSREDVRVAAGLRMDGVWAMERAA